MDSFCLPRSTTAGRWNGGPANLANAHDANTPVEGSIRQSAGQKTLEITFVNHPRHTHGFSDAQQIWSESAISERVARFCAPR
jgi:hypothetical protein